MTESDAMGPVGTARRVGCANEHGGREGFGLSRSGAGIRIDTPGVIGRTHWTREQATHLRDALTALLAQDGRSGRR